MEADIDHIVLWVEDPARAVAFYRDVVGLEVLRFAEFEAKKVPFPSVRLSSRSILDLMPRAMAPIINGVARKAGVAGDAAGHLVSHLCIATSQPELVALKERLGAAGIDTSFKLNDSFGARGQAPEAFYFPDPDGNVLEARYYA